MITTKNKILLKKSYEVRKLLDILVNSNNIVFLHIDKFYGEAFEKFKQDLNFSKVNISLINKDRLVLPNFSFVAKGPTLIVYSENFFYNELISILEKNKISYEVLLLKSQNYTSLEKLNILIKKYSMTPQKVYNFFFFLISFYKNLIFFLNYILKIYYKQLILLFYNRLFALFFLYKQILISSKK
jgi:hypothetical protein